MPVETSRRNVEEVFFSRRAISRALFEERAIGEGRPRKKNLDKPRTSKSTGRSHVRTVTGTFRANGGIASVLYQPPLSLSLSRSLALSLALSLFPSSFHPAFPLTVHRTTPSSFTFPSFSTCLGEILYSRATRLSLPTLAIVMRILVNAPVRDGLRSSIYSPGVLSNGSRGFFFLSLDGS